MSKTAILCLFVTGVLGVMSGGRADDVLPGHSHYGEAFNRGPRRNAYLMGGTGSVHLPISTKSPLAQRFFDQGIGQLHGFWYGEAERSFREVLRLDPNCGMAYWGLAQAAIIDKKRAAQFAADARKHKMGLSEREQMYIDALGNESGYRPLIAKYPNELEAKAFEVWRQWHIAEAGGGVAGDLEGGFTLAQEILKVAPMHPIHHAVIHIADGTHTYKRGLDSAPKCGEAAPSIGHMWHMPTHIYASLKRYPEATWQLEACLRTNNARTMHDHVMPYQVELYTHNNEWLIRMLMHMGRVREARRVAQEMIDYPRHPRFNAMEPPEEPVKKKSQAKKSKTEPSESDESGQDQTHESHGASTYYGRDRLFQLLRRFEYWDELIEDCRSGYLEATRMPAEQGKRHANLGVAYYSSGDVPDGDRELAAIRRLRDEQAVEREAAFEEVSRRPEVEQSAAAGAVEKRFNRRLASLETQIDQLQAYRRIVTGVSLSRGQLVLYLGILAGVEVILLWILRRRMMRALLSGVAALVVAGWLVYCHLALVNLPDDAVNVDFAFVTRKQMDVGDFDQAVWSAVRFAGERPRQVRPLANLVEALSKSGNKRKHAGNSRVCASWPGLPISIRLRWRARAHRQGVRVSNRLAKTAKDQRGSQHPSPPALPRPARVAALGGPVLEAGR